LTSLPWRTTPCPVPPRLVGTLQSGTLEIPILGGLTVDEADTIAELLAQDQSAFVRGAKLADAIATEEDINISEAFSIIEQAITGGALEADAQAIRLKHAERIEQMVRVYEAAGQRNMEASITAIIRWRLDRPEWTMEQTHALPRVLQRHIWQLIQEEQAAENLPASRPTDDDLKKQPPASGRGRKPTGGRSSGACPMPSPAPSVAAPSAES
jgi:hypothetical protein